jgi:hypothetical protein
MIAGRNQPHEQPAHVTAVRIALRTVAGDVLRARSACSRSAPRGHALRRCARAYGGAHRPPIAQTEPSSRGTSGRSNTGWVPSPSKPGSETSETALMRLPAGVGG